MYREALIICILCLFSCFATGCGKECGGRQAGTYVAPVVRSISELSDGDAVVSVDGEALTKKELFDFARFQAFVYSIQAKLPITDESVVNFRREREMDAIAKFVIQQILVNEANRRKLEVTPEMEKAQIRNFAGLMNVGAENATYESLAEIAGVSGKALRRLLTGNQLAQMVKNSFTVAPESIDEAEITNIVEHVAKMNKECSASNELQNAVLERAIKSIRGGMAFKDAAKEFSEIKPEESAFWGSFSKAELKLYEHKGHKMTDWAFSAPVGSITEAPVQLDDGIGIVKILGRTEGVDEPSVVSTAGPSTVELARITRKAFDPPKIMSPGELRKKIAAERTRNAQVDFNKKLFVNSCIQYPNGTNLWDKGLLQ